MGTNKSTCEVQMCSPVVLEQTLTVLGRRDLFCRLLEWNQQVMENVMTLSMKSNNMSEECSHLPQKGFFRRYCHCWHLLRISSVLEANLNVLSKAVPRHLYSSTISALFPWIALTAASARSLCLLERVTTVSLVFTPFQLCHQHTLPDGSLDWWTCNHLCKWWRGAEVSGHSPEGSL